MTFDHEPPRSTRARSKSLPLDSSGAVTEAPPLRSPMHAVGATNALLRPIGRSAASLERFFAGTDSGRDASPFYARSSNESDGVNPVKQDAVRQKLIPSEFYKKTEHYVMSEAFRGIRIKSPDGSQVSKNFRFEVHKALSRICKVEDGRRLLDAIRENYEATGNEIFISPTFSIKEKSGVFGLLKRRRYLLKRSNWTGEERVGTFNQNYVLDEESAYNASLSGKGTHSFIEWDPQNGLPGDDDSTPPITLAHELIHAERKQSGNSVAYRHMHDAHRGTTRADNRQLEENMTVGLVDGFPFSENNIRMQMGLKKRERYY